MNNLEKTLVSIGAPADKTKMEKFYKYRDLILERNQHINLTAIKDPDEFEVKHYVDSVLAYALPEYSEGKKILDVGTGGGFPGIPLAIISPDKEFVLMDSLLKRLKVIDEFAGELDISNVSILHGRAEELSQKADFRECFDVCVSRAVANLAVLCELCLPFVKVGGHFISYKGPEAEDELRQAQNAVHILGGGEARIKTVEGTLFWYDHKFVVIKKVKPTPKKYPRKPGMPSKEPL